MGTDATTAEAQEATTTVEVRCTGHVRSAVGTGKMEYSFPGTTLREFLTEFFEEYDVEEMLIAETEDEATTSGWAQPPEEYPEDWTKNPEGEQTRRYARVTINGEFNEHLDGLDSELEEGDRVALIYPFVYCV